MTSLFWRQFSALFWKNCIVLLRHPFLNIVRCLLLPVAYGVFLSVAQNFLSQPNNYGLGTSIPIFSLNDTFSGTKMLYWVDLTNGTTSPSPQAIISQITQNFTSQQLAAVKELGSSDEIVSSCPPNFQVISRCFAAIEFYDISEPGPINYTLRADAGVAHIDAPRHRSDFELRILPLQWAIDKAIIKERTGEDVQTPFQWPFTVFTNTAQDLRYRLKYIRGIRNLLVLAFFVGYIGIAYQLPGAVASERANLITSHMKAMGLLDSAKIISWHLSQSMVFLPAWIVISLIWHFRIYTETHVLLISLVHVLCGLSLASWSFFISAPFGKSPQLAAVTTTFVAILIAIIALAFMSADTITATIFTILLPPGYYVFAIRAICGFENMEEGASLIESDPDHNLRLLPLLIAAVVNIFLWPFLSVLLENRLYGAHNPKPGRKLPRDEAPLLASMNPGIAISIKHLRKTFSTSVLRGKKVVVTAVEDLTFDIPKNGIFVLLGSNGAGKSTTLSILGGLTGRTRGSVQFEGGKDRPGPGVMGIVPQKNVLFPELTCLQTLQIWKAIKFSKNSDSHEDLEQLLRDCDLGHKIHYNAAALSGGQKRRLQLAIGLVGGSKIVLVDECTSGVDPLSRRAIWRILTSVRHERTIVFTTHFLDEADLLADNIAILAAPGKLVAEGSPVSLKRDLGAGYTVQASLPPFLELKGKGSVLPDILSQIREITPNAYLSTNGSFQALYHLNSKDSVEVQAVLHILEDHVQRGLLQAYDLLGTTLEDIFLELMNGVKRLSAPDPFDRDPVLSKSSFLWQSSDTLVEETAALPSLELSRGRPVSPWKQAATIFYKRCLIARRSWLTPLFSVLVAVCGTTLPLGFISDRPASCIIKTEASNSTSFPLYPPISPVVMLALNESETASIWNSPPGLIKTLGNTTTLRITDIPDNRTFVDAVYDWYQNTSYGGVSMDLETGAMLIAWEAGSPGYTGSSLLNLADNLLYNDAVNRSGRPVLPGAMIQANYASFPPLDDGTLLALKWSTFFGATMAVYTAFFALYVATERATAVQAMQFSNGLSNPAGLWLGHLFFDVIFSFISASAMVIVFSVVAGDQFHGLIFFWIVLVLYGIAATLFAYCVSQIISSPLGAFAGAAGYQIVMFLTYFAGYLFTFTYANVDKDDMIITTIHFTVSILSPIASVQRAAFVSINLFSLLCVDNETISATATASIMRYGGPIIYLLVQIAVLFGILVRVDKSIWRVLFWRKTETHRDADIQMLLRGDGKSDVEIEARNAANSDDLLRVLGVSKTFGSNKVVDDVTLSASKDTIFALLGPNGAGKTTTFNMIRGDMAPDVGDILIAGQSIVRSAKKARFALGVCPQFTAIDSALTVREHLQIYGRLKGLGKGSQLRRNVQSLMGATALLPYADRLASKMSGGNQRKLSLAIALMGNPSVILIDEFSTGVDAKMKRDMWVTLRNVAAGKAVVITTHSMEEASALANKVGILAKRVLAVGTIDDMSSRFATYEVHFTCRTRQETMEAQILMSSIPGSRMADDVATRFEIPIGTNFSLAQLFDMLSSSGKLASQFTVEKATLESIFLKVIRANDVAEEDRAQGRSWT